MRVLDAIREQNYDTLSKRPVVTRPRKAWLALGAALSAGGAAAAMMLRRDKNALDAAYAECQAITKREARNFYYAFLALPPRRRRAVYAAYAFSPPRGRHRGRRGRRGRRSAPNSPASACD